MGKLDPLTKADYNAYVRPDLSELANRPPIFDERNRLVWEAARRFMIFLLKELDKYYGWNTFEKK